ncbi:GNAT family N-acetyltransferase [Tateyamaria omphalii]|uniref:L-ornithine N(alpha)-acyltransferase n=1 Tax=Tateyamaria omphalii TaxID=299262 RepID=A0A1P8MU74_9RHOB|nr:GNAT family N-acyltransferase [Tateyamaria omphalii]APX11489.1 ornithine-acyl-ACP acyltransferase [Tateyamaria omphalii]
MTLTHVPEFRVSLADTDADLRAAQRLRYDVFVRELRGGGPLVDHEAGLERDRFDPFFDHLLLHDDAVGQVVAVYRMLRAERAEEVGQFYSEDEYDLAPLHATGRRLLELGRSCVHAAYRGGPALYHMWNGLAAYVAEHRIDIMFGVASFHGTNVPRLAAPLSLLHHRHLAPEPLRVRARAPHAVPMDLVPEAGIDRRAAMLEVPALIKAYLRLGGVVGAGAYVDHTFNTTDVCMIMDTAAMSERQKRIYGAQS